LVAGRLALDAVARAHNDRWQMRTPRALVAYLGAVIAVGSACAAPPTPTASVMPPASASVRVTPSPSSLPTPPYREAKVIARIPLPHPYAQTAGDIAVTSEAIFIANYSDGSFYLARVDVATNQISDVVVDPPALAIGDGAVWMVSPVGGAPTPPSVTLSRVDVRTGEPRVVAEMDFADRLAVGLGGVWVADGELRLLDAESGAVTRVLPWSAIGLQVACGELWGWDLSSDEQDPRWLLDRLDPLTGNVLEQFALPDGVAPRLVEIDGWCWTNTQCDLYGVAPGEELIITQSVGPTQFAGSAVWSATERGVVQRLDPRTGDGLRDPWQLPEQDLHVDPKGRPDWRLLATGGSLWLLGGDQIVRYDIPAIP